MSNDTLKTAICDALTAWIRQRPGLDFNSYGDVTAYRAEQRSIALDKRDAEILLQAVRWRDSITGDMMVDAAKHSFSGRLEIRVTKYKCAGCGSDTGKHEDGCANSDGNLVDSMLSPRVTFDYTTGQYWPTEYRRAAAALCARLLWNYQRDSMPKPTAGRGGDERYPFQTGSETRMLNAGDWLRCHFRKEFGSRLQRRWFN